ncbi:MAG: hypothetical protein IJ058_15275 [Lachnospiraceae bacterium]|nr:hypothetical protein [Lachnospiraceae bacterium]MBQ8948142.1 hypothetical protein [Lachnospiraceae bacterium]
MAGQGRQRELRTVASVYQKEVAKFNRAIEKYASGLEERLNEVGLEVVGRWYAEYPDPHVYRRKRSLYHAFRVERQGYSINVIFDSELMEDYGHRVSNEYIFENSFIRGFHGGADKISDDKVAMGRPPHPDPGSPIRFPEPEIRSRDLSAGHITKR